jgi:hypothetical protein
MVKPQLIEYIQQQFDQGFSADAIVDALLTQGWEPDEIEEALESFQVLDTPKEARPIEEIVFAAFDKIPKDKKLPTILIAIAILLLIIALSVWSLPEFRTIETNTGSSATTSAVAEQPVSVTTSPTARQDLDEVREITAVE